MSKKWVAGEEVVLRQAYHEKEYRNFFVMIGDLRLPVGSEITTIGKAAPDGKSYLTLEKPIVHGDAAELRRIAKLIAAAPELLEALKRAQNYIGEPLLAGSLHHNVSEAISAAIAKAEGRT